MRRRRRPGGWAGGEDRGGAARWKPRATPHSRLRAGLARLKNGNPGMVVASDIDYGEECWASHDGRAVAVGRFKAGELHPSRVFNQ